MDSEPSGTHEELKIKEEVSTTSCQSPQRDAVRPTSTSPDADVGSTTEEEDNDDSSSSGSETEYDESGSHSDSSSCSSKSDTSSTSSVSKKSSRSPSVSLDSCLERSRDVGDTTNENSSDHNESLSRNKRHRVSPDLKDVINNNPDMYGLRRSSRSRKEPVRFTAKDYDISDSSDEDRRPRRKKLTKRKRTFSRGRRTEPKAKAFKSCVKSEIRRFVKSYRKFPNPMKRIDAVALDAGLQDKPMEDLNQLAEDLQNGCEKCVKEHLERLQEAIEDDNATALERKGDRKPSFEFYGVTVYPKKILFCQQELETLEHHLQGLSADDRKLWRFPFDVRLVKDWSCEWITEDDSRLLTGVFQYGMGSWEAIKKDPTFGLSEKILPNDSSKPQAKHLATRVRFLLRALSKSADEREKTTRKKKSDPSKIKNGSERKSKKKHKEKSKSRDKKKKRSRYRRDPSGPAMHFTANAAPQIIDADLSPKIFADCKEKMRPVKKQLKELGWMNSKHLNHPSSSDINCLLKIGDRIKECLLSYQEEAAVKEWRNNLWTFVSKFTEFTPRKLYRKYRAIVSGEFDHHPSSSYSRYPRESRPQDASPHKPMYDDRNHYKMPLKRGYNADNSPPKHIRQHDGGHCDGPPYDGYRNWHPPPRPLLPPINHPPYGDVRPPFPNFGLPPGPPLNMPPYNNFSPGSSFRGNNWSDWNRDWNRGSSAPSHPIRPKNEFEHKPSQTGNRCYSNLPNT